MGRQRSRDFRLLIFPYSWHTAIFIPSFCERPLHTYFPSNLMDIIWWIMSLLTECLLRLDVAKYSTRVPADNVSALAQAGDKKGTNTQMLNTQQEFRQTTIYFYVCSRVGIMKRTLLATEDTKHKTLEPKKYKTSPEEFQNMFLIFRSSGQGLCGGWLMSTLPVNNKSVTMTPAETGFGG